MYPLTGEQRVAQFLLGITNRGANAYRFTLTEINGNPGMLIYSEQEVSTAISFEVVNNHIQTIHAISNPDKLAVLHIGDNA